MFEQRLNIAVAIGLALQVTGCSTANNQYNNAHSARVPAASQTEVTPFEKLKEQVDIRKFKGQTYLSFMKNTVFPKMNSFMPAIEKEEASKPGKFSDWQTDWRNSGDGVAIRIDDQNYYFNLGYRDGKDPVNDILSGRSYGVSLGLDGKKPKQSDPSDLAYLKELGQLLSQEKGSTDKFYDAILKVVLNCDTSGISGLSLLGQSVATDFLAIYTAESARHFMINLAPGKHPWEIDLAAATFSASFVAVTGKFMQDDSTFIDGNVTQFWAKGTKGSGIGETRQGRKNLQRLIANFEASKNADQLNKIKAAYKGKDDDVIQGLFEYLNTKDGPMKIAGEATLRADFVKYIDTVTSDASDILKSQGTGKNKRSAKAKVRKINPDDQDDANEGQVGQIQLESID